MKNIIKKIIIILLFVIILLTQNIYARYNYIISLEAFKLNRDFSEITYSIEKSKNDEEYTNEDIGLKIISNKEIEEVEGFSLDESKKVLSRTISQNEEKTIVLKDLSGNTKEVNYNIKNIDKELPQIIGVEDGATYTSAVQLEYIDNVAIKDISVDRYSDGLKIDCYQDYYDTPFYKGIDVSKSEIYIDVTEHPKGTTHYKFYLNNELKVNTEKSEYTFTGLQKATTYSIVVQALNDNEEVLDSETLSVKTKCYDKITSRREGDNFYITITGIDEEAYAGYSCLWHQNSQPKNFKYPTINSDRSINFSFNAYEVDGTKCNGYYYLHFQLWNNTKPELNDVIPMNFIFSDSVYTKYDDDNIDVKTLSARGKYQIIVTDVAGNKTEKNCEIK